MGDATQHTQEPLWEAVDNAIGNGSWLLRNGNKGDNFASFYYAGSEERAKRAATCRNACRNILNPEVTLPKLVEALEMCEAAISYLLMREQPTAVDWTNVRNARQLAYEALAGVKEEK